MGGYAAAAGSREQRAAAVCGWARQQLIGAGLWRGACTGWEEGLWLKAWPLSSETCLVKAEVQASGTNSFVGRWELTFAAGTHRLSGRGALCSEVVPLRPRYGKFGNCFALLDLASNIAVSLCAGIGCGTSCLS